MKFDREKFLRAARVPPDLHPQKFGLWTIERRAAPPRAVLEAAGEPDFIGFPSYTLLRRWREAPGIDEDPFAAEVRCGFTNEIVMEDSRRELLQHAPIWNVARGRVLVTGLGLGCVVRGLLASDHVTRVDVVELDSEILDVVGPEFAGEPRVELHHGDALKVKWPATTRWDFAWHDLWTDGPVHLQNLHVQLLKKYRKHVPRQGAWKLPRLVKRLVPTVIP